MWLAYDLGFLARGTGAPVSPYVALTDLNLPNAAPLASCKALANSWFWREDSVPHSSKYKHLRHSGHFLSPNIQSDLFIPSVSNVRPRTALMLFSLLVLCSAAVHALQFDGGISLSQLPTPALLVDVDELPGGGVDTLPTGRAERREALRDALFIHARVIAAGKERAGFYKGRGAPLAELDVELAGDAYLRRA